MSDRHYPNENDIHIARTGLMIQFEQTDLIKNFPGTTEEAINLYGLGDFIENTVQVIATEKMWHRITQNLLNESLVNAKPTSPNP